MNQETDGAGVPVGVPPAAVLAQRERLKAVLATEQPGKSRQKMTVVARAKPDPSTPGGDDDKYLTHQEDIPAKHKWNPRPLKLEHDLFSLELEVLEFSNTGKFITILFSRKFALAEPENVCYFKLHFGGRTYPVEHMGINFEIPTLGVKGVTFVVSDDKARQT